MNRTDLQLAHAHRGPRPRARLPAHCRSTAPRSLAVQALERRLRRLELRTVCEEAHCPNRNACFARDTASFMLLGPVCTRTCRFCNVTTGRPGPVDANEPGRVAEGVRQLGLRHAVLTSVNRDDLPDGGASHFASAIAAIRGRAPAARVEVLTPDFAGDARAIDTVAGARPDVYNHNVETVPRLYRTVRPGAAYARSLDLLFRVSSGPGPGPVTKSGIMLGLGESADEVREVLRDLRGAGVAAVTLGQYLRPTLRHLPVERYLEPKEFEAFGEQARGLGFSSVASGPLVRSSYCAESTYDDMETRSDVPLR